MSREKEIVGAALELDSADERRGYVLGACGDDEELLGRVEFLVEAFSDAEEENFLDRTVVDGAAPVREGEGSVIGRYKLLQQLGEGGFGVVYMAEQREPVKRRVALKIIKLGMDTGQVVARFEAERQALAMMDHPNIAKVFDAGATETGRPYFVMELVKGVPITEFCDETKFSTRERLELFVQVCQAVQHAHQKGVIHRDLKPNNVMVTMHDERAVPKVIDFGVAKATQQELTEKTLFTRYEQFVGTPTYMSPEQAQFSGLDIDTRSDIYSLGLLLYELLTGQTPITQQELREIGYDEMRRKICEAEPPKPSTRLKTLEESERTALAIRRSAEPGRLVSSVRGDLDWIVMKALEKDRQRRYETANALAMDLKRLLQDEPVLAVAPSRAYRLRKYFRRHKAELLTASAIIGLLIAGTVVSTWFAFGQLRARKEVDAALAVKDVALQEVVVAQSRTEVARRVADDALLDLIQSDDAKTVSWLTHRAVVEHQDPHLKRLHTTQVRSWASQMAVPVACVSLQGDIVELEFHPGGRYLTIGSWAGQDDYRSYVQDLESGAELALPSTSGEIVKSKWNESGTLLSVAAQGGEVSVLTFPGLRNVAKILPDGGEVRSLEFVSDDHLAIGNRGSVRIVGIGATARSEELKISHTGTVYWMQFDSASQMLLSYSGGSVKVSRVVPSDGLVEERCPPIPHSPRVMTEAPAGIPPFLVDGKTLVTNSAETGISWWDLGDPVKPGRLKSNASDEKPNSMALSPDGRRIAIGRFREATLWDAGTGERIGSMAKHRNTIYALAFSPDGGTVYSGGWDGALKGWSVNSQSGLGEIGVHLENVSRIAVSDRGDLLAAAQQDGQVRVWRLTCGSDLLPVVPSLGRRGSVKFSHDGRFVYAAGGTFGYATVHETQLRHSATGEPAGPPIRPGNVLLDADLAADGRTLATIQASVGDLRRRGAILQNNRNANAYSSNTVLGLFDLWDALSGERLIASIPMPSEPRSVAIRPGSSHEVAVACATGEVLQIFLSGEESPDVRQVGVPYTNTSPSSFTNNGRVGYFADGELLVSWGFDNSVRVWNSASLQPRFPPIDLGAKCRDVIVSPDRNHLVTMGDDRQVRFWDLESGGESGLHSLPHPDWVFQGVFTSDGDHLLTAGRDGAARLWNWRDGSLACAPFRHEDEVKGVGFLDGERVVVTIGYDKSLRLWDRKTGSPLGPPLDLNGKPFTLKCSPDQNRFAVAGDFNGYQLGDLKELVPDEFPDVEALLLQSDVLTGRKIEFGTSVKLDSSRWMESWQEAKQGWPEVFGLGSEAERSAWHLRKSMTGDDRSSLFHLEHLVGLHPTELLFQIQKAKIHLDRQEWGKVIQICNAVSERDPANLEAFYYRARSHFELKQWQEAQDDIDKLLKLDLLSESIASMPLSLRSAVRAELGEWAGAAEDLRRTVDLSTCNIDSVHRYVVAHLAAGDLARYREACSIVLGRIETSENIDVLQLVLWLCCIGPDAVPDYSVLDRLVEKIEGRKHDDHFLAAGKGALACRRGKYQEANALLSKLMDAHEHRGNPVLFLAMSCARLGNLDEAKHWISETADEPVNANWKTRAIGEALLNELQEFSK